MKAKILIADWTNYVHAINFEITIWYCQTHLLFMSTPGKKNYNTNLKWNNGLKFWIYYANSILSEKRLTLLIISSWKIIHRLPYCVITCMCTSSFVGFRIKFVYGSLFIFCINWFISIYSNTDVMGSPQLSIVYNERYSSSFAIWCQACRQRN